ncbi:MAG: von Willebrand factor type A domain-containing protein [Acidimicrobiia bacterium]
MMRKTTIALLAVILLVGACGGNDDSSDTTYGRIDQTTTTAAASQTTASPGHPTPIAGDQRATATTAMAETTTTAGAMTEEPRDVNFEDYGANPFEDPIEDSMSTFAVDVDTGSYTLMRAWINDGYLPDPDSVRVEEYVNYFDGGYQAPDDSTFAIYADGGPTPYWDPANDILRIGIKAREVTERQRQDMNLTLVVDVSGSMGDQNKLKMVQDALAVLIGELDRYDTVGIVSYNTDARVVLEPTPASDADTIIDAIYRLSAGGNTNAEAGLLKGYDMADDSYQRDAVNRVVLLSDGVANVGNTGPGSILEQIGDRTREDIDLVTIGVGISTYNDVLLEQLADQGNGWYAYVDTKDEAVKLFREQLTTSLETVARNAKVQVEFDPEYVDGYRLIGFENRAIADQDFRDDSVDAGEINAGHTVTALYELDLTRDAYRTDEPFATVHLRWIDPDTGRSEEIQGDVSTALLADRFDETSAQFQLVSSVAAYAEVLRDSRWVRGLHLDDVLAELDGLPWRQLNNDAADEFYDIVSRAVRLEA